MTELHGGSGERYVIRSPTGYQLRVPGHSKAFHHKKYGSWDNAKTAAIACRDRYLDTGEVVAPPPVYPSIRQLATELGVPYQQLYRRVQKTSVTEAYEHFRDHKE